MSRKLFVNGFTSACKGVYTWSMEITKNTEAGTTTYAAIIDGQQVAFLDIDSITRKVTNVETVRTHRNQGIATALWEHANEEAECFHALEHHRTADGEMFAASVGGDTIDEDDDYIEDCCICTGQYDIEEA